MTPEEKKLLIEVNEKLENFLNVYYRTNFVDKMIMSKPLNFIDGVKILFGRTTGTKIGSTALEKLSVWGATPIVQPGAISDPSGGATVDSQSRTAISSILTALRNVGIIHT
jgi:hypothetical protein